MLRRVQDTAKKAAAAVTACLALTLTGPVASQTTTGPATSTTDLLLGLADATRSLTTQSLLVQAAYALAAESSDLDGDGYPEAPAMAVGVGPVGGGVIPATSGAPKTDYYGAPIGYCAFDIGPSNVSAGRISVSGPWSYANTVFAVVSAGSDGVFSTNCASLVLGSAPAGDDIVVVANVNQVNQGIGGTLFWRDPVASAVALASLSPSGLKDGEIRLQKDTNQLMRWNQSLSIWQSVSSSLWQSSGSNMYYNGGSVGIGVSSPTARLQVGNGDLRIGTGTFEASGSAVAASNRLVFDNNYGTGSANKVVLYSDLTWVAGFGIQSNTLGYYSGGRHSFYTGTTQASAGTETVRVDNSGLQVRWGSLQMPGKQLLTFNSETATSPNVSGQISGALGFYGFGVSHGQFHYRMGKGFEFLDVSSTAPSTAFVDGGAPFAPLYASKGVFSAGVNLGDVNTYLTKGAGDSMRVQSPSGYLDIGAQNGSYAYFQTDRPAFYFNRDLYVNGALVLNSSNAPYAYNMNQYVRTIDAPLFAGLTINGNATVNGNLRTYGINLARTSSFYVGGSSSYYYPVQIGVNTTSGVSSPFKFQIYRPNVHDNGSWYGTFSARFEGQTSNWGHTPSSQSIRKIEYYVGSGSPYNDPLGDITDGSFASGGSDLIVWLRGGATYYLAPESANTEVMVLNANASGTNITDSSGAVRGAISSQSAQVVSAKNGEYMIGGLSLGGILNGRSAIFQTSGYTSNSRTVTIMNQGGSQLNFGAYPGQWRSAIQLQGNDNSHMLWMAPGDSDYNNAIIYASQGGLEIRTGGNNNGGSAITTIDASGNITTSGSISASSLLPKGTGSSQVMMGRSALNGLYSYQTYGDPNAPAYYGAAVGFGAGGGGEAEIMVNWVNNSGMWYRSLRDCCQNWSGWVRVLDSGIDTYAANMNQYVRTTDAPTFAGVTINGAVNNPSVIGISPSYYNSPILTGNWNGAGYWGMGSSGTHTIRFDQISGSPGVPGQGYAGASDINLMLGTNTVVHTGNVTQYEGGWVHSGRDFAYGTLITTDIDYNTAYGYPWVLEMKGNSYGMGIPIDIQVQGYIYYNTIINYGGYSNGSSIGGIIAINYNGYLSFWFPRQAYWQGFNVRAYIPYAGMAHVNHVTGISDTYQPTSYKQVNLYSNIVQSLHSGNYWQYTGGGGNGGNVVGQEMYTNGWFRNYNSGMGMYNQATALHFYSDSNYWNVAVGGGGTTGIRFRNNYNGAILGYAYADTSGQSGWLSNDGNWRLRTWAGGQYLHGATNVDYLNILDGNTNINRGNGYSMRINTPYGWGEIGAQNSSYFHLQTDRLQFYFNKAIRAESSVGVYNTNNYIDTAGFVSGGYRIADNSGYLWGRNTVSGDNTTKTTSIPNGNPNSWMPSGFFNSNTGTNVPYTSWWMMLNARHYNEGNNYGFQLMGDFYADNFYFRRQNGDSFGAWQRVALEGANNSFSGGWNRFYSNRGWGSYSGSYSDPGLQAFSSDGGAAFMSFHRGGYYAVNMGLDYDNVLRIGGWSASSNRWQLDMSGNEYAAGTITSQGGAFQIYDGNTRLSRGVSYSMRISTPYGWGDLGPQNSSWFHFNTDRGQFYFGSLVRAEGSVGVYNTNNYIDTAGFVSGGARIADNSGQIFGNEVYSRGWFRNYDSGEGMYNQATALHFYSDSNYWNVALGGGGTTGIRFRNNYSGAILGYAYAQTDGQSGWLSNDGSWRLRTWAGGQYLHGSTNVDYLNILDGNTNLNRGVAYSLRISTPYGWGDLGPQNTGWFHFNTDRGQFYFGSQIWVNGTMGVYGTSNYIDSSGFVSGGYRIADNSGQVIARNLLPSTTYNNGGGAWYFGSNSWGGNGPASVGVNSATGVMYSGGGGSQLFTFSSTSAQTSVQLDGSLFVGDGIGYNYFGANGSTTGNLVVQSNTSVGGALAVAGRTYANGGVQFADGTVQTTSAAPTGSLGSTGYQRMSNGMIMQWGTYNNGGWSGNVGYGGPVIYLPYNCPNMLPVIQLTSEGYGNTSWTSQTKILQKSTNWFQMTGDIFPVTNWTAVCY